MARENGERKSVQVQVHPEISTAASLLAHDVPNFAREAIHLAKLEAMETAKSVGLRAAIVSVSGYASMVGFFLLCVGLAFLISELLERAWAGPLIVGGGLMVLAGIAAPIALKAGGRPSSARAS